MNESEITVGVDEWCWMWMVNGNRRKNIRLFLHRAFEPIRLGLLSTLQ